MAENKGLDFELDTLGIISLTLTFISILLSINLSLNTIVLSVGVFSIIVATYMY